MIRVMLKFKQILIDIEAKLSSEPCEIPQEFNLNSKSQAQTGAITIIAWKSSMHNISIPLDLEIEHKKPAAGPDLSSNRAVHWVSRGI